VAEFKDSPNTKIPDKEIIKEIEADNEKEYLKELKKKNEGFLVENLSLLQRERIAQKIIDYFEDVKTKHKEIEDKQDENDAVYRMERKEVAGSQGTLSNYRSPMSTVSTEVIHSNYMNVFFTPKDIGRVLPTEEGDIGKVGKLSTFMNWSCKNELNLFEGLDRLFHNSTKNGEAPYLMHWVKEFGTKIVRKPIPDPTNPDKPLFDPDTKDVIVQETEEEVLLYNAPKFEPFSRKDYYQPKNAVMGRTPDWEGMKIRMTYDEYLREQLQGKMYADTISEIKGWGQGRSEESNMIDVEGDQIPVGDWEKEFMVWFGRMKINVIKDDKDDSEAIDMEELEDEFIAIVNMESNVLCQLRRNKFPLKQRPIGLDYFMPDDEGRRSAIGVIGFMEGLQKAYDVLYNEFMTGTTNANNPILLMEPLGNKRDEKTKIQNGFIYMTPNAGTAKWFQFPQPDASLTAMLKLITSWGQLLFGISDYQSGIDSRTDPEAPAKKAQIVVQQGNVRMNAIIKRKIKTIQDILNRWFLLYQQNLPANKFVRVAGEEGEEFRFQSMHYDDFSLASNPDFELTGNFLNMNKSLELNRKIGTYQLMFTNPLFNPQVQGGVGRLLGLTKWIVDELDESGSLASLLPQSPGQEVKTPEEENARFLQGDTGEPTQGEDHPNHLKVHQQFLQDPNIPEELKMNVIKHIHATIKMIQEEREQQMVMMQMGQPQKGGQDAQPSGAGQVQAGTAQPMVQGQTANMGGFGG